MKPILVLGPDEPGSPALERGHVDLCRVPAAAEVVAGAGAYDSVIVINDGGAGTIRRVQLALGMRRRRPQLAVGVVTYLTAAGGVGEAAVVDWATLGPQLRIELKEAMLSLEYQAD